jgi:hypothetical protein
VIGEMKKDSTHLQGCHNKGNNKTEGVLSVDIKHKWTAHSHRTRQVVTCPFNKKNRQASSANYLTK